MRKKDQNAIAYPGNYVPNTPFPEVEPPRHTVVQADNKVSPPQVLALAFAVLFVMASVVVWALWDLTGWSVAVVTVIVTPEGKVAEVINKVPEKQYGKRLVDRLKALQAPRP